jgi:plasmid maintenance system antidote protein VapI
MSAPCASTMTSSQKNGINGHASTLAARFAARTNTLRSNPAFVAAELKLAITEDILHRMEELHMSRSDLARLLGCSRAAITRMLDKERNLTLQTISTVAVALRCGVELRLNRRPLSTTQTKKSTSAAKTKGLPRLKIEN